MSSQNNDSDERQYRWDEYKLLQDKIDKIGAFKFQIKNWMVGLVTALLVAAYVGKLPFWTHLICLPIILAFFLLEVLQDNWAGACGQRAREIEAELRRKGSSVFEKRRKVRYSSVKSLDKFPPDSPTHALYLRFLHLRKSCFGRLVLHAHGFFYLVLICVVAIASIATIARPIALEKGGILEQNSFDDIRQEKSADTDRAIPILLPSAENAEVSEVPESVREDSGTESIAESPADDMAEQEPMPVDELMNSGDANE